MIRPTQDNVIVALEELPAMTASGLHLVHKTERGARASRWARVIATGPGHYRQVPRRIGDRKYTEDGVFIPNETRVGDRVCVDEDSGQNYDFDLSIPRHNVSQQFQELCGERGQFRIVRESEIHLIERGEAEAAE